MKYLSLDEYKDIQGRTLKDIIRGKQELLIPPYQRDFDWNVDDIDKTALINDFLDSLEELSKDTDNEFFFGQIVLAKKDDNTKTAYIIDGQQRLTTFFILIHCIATRITNEFISESAKYYIESEVKMRRNIEASEHDEIQSINSIVSHISDGAFHEWFFNKEQKNNQSLHAKIKLQNKKHHDVWPIIFNDSCSATEARSVYDAMKSNGTKFSNGDDKLIDAYEYIEDWVGKRSNKHLIDIFAKSLFTDDAPKIHAVLMDVTSLDTGINIFHGINAKGKQLGPTDLIKAQMCRVGEAAISGAESPMVNEQITTWMSLFEAYEKEFDSVYQGKEEVFVSFILNYIYSQYDEDNEFDYRIAEKTLNNVYEEILNSASDVDRELQRIKALSRIFFLLHDTKINKTGFSSREIKNSSRRNKVNYMLLRMHGFLGKSVQYYRIILLAFLELADDKDSEELTYNEEESVVIDTIVLLMERVYCYLVRAKITEMKPQEQRAPIKTATKEINLRLRSISDSASLMTKCETILESATDKLRQYDAADNDIKLRLENNTYPRSRSATFINNLLWEIEYFLQNKSEFAKEMLSARKKYDGDHIFPETNITWESYYDNDSFDSLKASLDQIGNRCPLHNTSNRSVKNKPMQEKMPFYLNCDLKTHTLMLEAIAEVHKETQGVEIELFTVSKIGELKEKIKNGEIDVNNLWNLQCIKALGKKYAQKILETFPRI